MFKATPVQFKDIPTLFKPNPPGGHLNSITHNSLATVYNEPYQ
jgi:hypothetical protein